VRHGLLVLIAIGSIMACLPASAQEEEPTGSVTPPLDVEILYPPDGAAFREANLTVLVEADGATSANYRAPFENGSFVNATADAQGIHANASGPTNESFYISPVMELPTNGSGFVWTDPIDFLTSGSSGYLGDLLALDVRFGDRTPGRNWTAWYEAEITGDFNGTAGPINESWLALPAMQYRFRFLDPLNASSPNVILVEVWYLAPIAKVEARLGDAGGWAELGTTGGRYNWSVVLPLGSTQLEARVTDVGGKTLVAWANVSYDLTAPFVVSAPPPGASIAPDAAARIVFSEPIDRASAAAAITITAAIPVDAVWSADNTTLFLSAAEATHRGQVNITIGTGLQDRAGNHLAAPQSFVYEMGSYADPGPPSNASLALPLALAVAGAAFLVLFIAQRAGKQRKEHVEKMRRELVEESGPRVAEPAPPEEGAAVGAPKKPI
jgi:hypothetical protein